ncbi:MAG: endonuclease [Bacteroidales bacterium]|nr:endonuclease [Bacteroidales bacterium]
MLLSFCFLGLFLLLSSWTEKQEARRYRVMWWNVENLFDTLHDEGHDDTEFLPTAARTWDSRRYWSKQGALAHHILALGGWQPVDLVGMCEVENDSVLHHLVHRTRLARLGYEYVMTRSADRRGVDVALLYQPESFRLLEVHTFRIPYDEQRERPTRDLLLCSGQVPHGDTLDVVLAHLPSRRGGASRSESYRLRCTRRIAQIVDSLSGVRQHFQMLCMGDFNDEATDRSVREGIGTRLVALSHTATPLPLPQEGSIEGTYFFRGAWSRIDQMLVSPSLLSPSAPLRTDVLHCHIYAPPSLLEAAVPMGVQPRRNYRGPHYHGGVSDHLPLFLDLYY